MDIISIIENKNNNILSCLLLTLFFNKNYIYNTFLESDNLQPNIIYFQEIIKNIINNNNYFKIISNSNINYLKNILLFNYFENFTNLYKNNNIIDLYDFLFNIFNIQKIELINTKKNSEIETHNFIDLIPLDNNTDIKTLISLTFENKILQNIPNFMAFKINRNNEFAYLDIKKKITINSIYNNDILTINTITSDSNKLIWKIHGIICYDKINDCYFSFINNYDDWYLISSNSITKIYIKNYENDIKSKSVFILYIFS